MFGWNRIVCIETSRSWRNFWGFFLVISAILVYISYRRLTYIFSSPHWGVNTFHHNLLYLQIVVSCWRVFWIRTGSQKRTRVEGFISQASLSFKWYHPRNLTQIPKMMFCFNVSPFKYGVILGIHVSFRGGGVRILYTLQGINISHLGKRKIIFKMPFLGDMLVPWRVTSPGPWESFVSWPLRKVFL